MQVLYIAGIVDFVIQIVYCGYCANHDRLLDASLLDPCPALVGVHHLNHYNYDCIGDEASDKDDNEDVPNMNATISNLLADGLLHVHCEHSKSTSIYIHPFSP